MICHRTSECKIKEDIQIVNGVLSPLFGVWLRASAPPRKINHIGKWGPPFLANGISTEKETDKRCEMMDTSRVATGQIKETTSGKLRAIGTHDDTCKNLIAQINNHNIKNGSATAAFEHIQAPCRPPDPGFYKINCDAVSLAGGRKVGIGVVIRDASGLVLASCSQVVEAKFTNQMAKILAILRGIIFSKVCSLEPCVLEFDEGVVVKRIADGSFREARIGIMLDNIAGLLKNSNGLNIAHIPRGANRVAHGLVKNTLATGDFSFWKEDLPTCIRSLVEADKPCCTNPQFVSF
ncbi:hypothetical protein EZV62_019864 [Acer yangbiense]|uniref:RNase H type-1 domain-containing protein n=1 Tax=Acer yangbiense TaxID=1000413 RepID=A0A5C7HCL8_9ROSI|nr:hypothetical protein EZV62_019864 [Acer yangbiense]